MTMRWSARKGVRCMGKTLLALAVGLLFIYVDYVLVLTVGMLPTLGIIWGVILLLAFVLGGRT